MDDEGADAAWVHAYLHRVEGDLPNARYWYAQAKRETATGTLDAEWAAISTALLVTTAGSRWQPARERVRNSLSERGRQWRRRTDARGRQGFLRRLCAARLRAGGHPTFTTTSIG